MDPELACALFMAGFLRSAWVPSRFSRDGEMRNGREARDPKRSRASVVLADVRNTKAVSGIPETACMKIED